MEFKLDLELRALQALHLEQEIAVDFMAQKAVIKIRPDFVKRNLDGTLEICGAAKIVHLAGSGNLRTVHATEIARVKVFADENDLVAKYEIAPEAELEEKITMVEEDIEFPPFLRQQKIAQ